MGHIVETEKEPTKVKWPNRTDTTPGVPIAWDSLDIGSFNLCWRGHRDDLKRDFADVGTQLD